MPEPVSARRTKTRERLAHAAMTLFAERGVLGASVEEVCEAAGFTRGAFYSNFSNKNELCIAILELQVEAQMAGIRQAIMGLALEASTTPLNVDDMITFAVRVFLSTQGHDRTAILSAVELRQHAVRDLEFRAQYNEFHGRASVHFVRALSVAAQQFGYRLLVPAEQAITILQGVFEQGALADMLASDADTVDASDSTSRLELFTSLLRALLVAE